MANDKIFREEQIWNSVYDEDAKALRITPTELVRGVDYDLITATYPNALTEIFTYTLSAVTVLTVTVVYIASDKKDISTVGFA